MATIYPKPVSAAQLFEAITPSDVTELVNIRAVFVGGAGNLSVVDADGVTVTFNGVSTGQILPISPSKIRSNGTTATGIIALR